MMWSITSKQLDLRYTWKLSRNAVDQKTNLIVLADDGFHSGIGEAAPNVRYDETPEKLLEEFERFKSILGSNEPDHDDLLSLISSMNLSHALSFAIESAFVHLNMRKAGISFSDLMKVPHPPNVIPISYTLPIMDPSLMKDFFSRENLGRFPYLKLKVNEESGFECLNYLMKFTTVPVMVDANEGFKEVDQAIRFLEKSRKFPLVLVEQLLPAKMKEETIHLKKYCPFPHFADETVTDQADFDYLKQAFDGVNVKLMKTGSYTNGINILKETQRHGLRTMIGCMVETTLGISSAMNLCGLTEFADLDSFLLLKEEPYGFITEENGCLFRSKK